MSLRIALEQQNFIRIPLKRLITGHYKLSMTVNGEKGSFILDTGASTSCIGYEHTLKFHLHLEESDILAAGAGATNMETSIAKDNLLSIGSKEIKELQLILFNLSHVNEALQQAGEEPIDGILGADLLKRLRAVIDYGRNCFYIK